MCYWLERVNPCLGFLRILSLTNGLEKPCTSQDT